MDAVFEKRINTCLLSSTLILFNAPPFTWWNRMAHWVVSSLTQLIERLKQLQFALADTGGRSVPVCSLFFRSPLKLLDGNFPCTGLNAVHDFNFFLLPWSLGVHPVCVCVCVCVCVTFSAYLCQSISAFVCLPLSISVYVCVCVCVYMSSEIYCSEHAGFRGICGSGHKAWIAQWLRSRPQFEVARIRIQTTQAQHQA